MQNFLFRKLIVDNVECIKADIVFGLLDALIGAFAYVDNSRMEYKNVLLILELLKMGRRPHQIANYLNEQEIGPRSGMKWFARTVTDIVRRERIK